MNSSEMVIDKFTSPGSDCSENALDTVQTDEEVTLLANIIDFYRLSIARGLESKTVLSKLERRGDMQ